VLRFLGTTLQVATQTACTRYQQPFKKRDKDMKAKLPIMLMIAFLLCLTGCKSEVDKCVDAFVKRDGTYKNSAEKADAEADYRLGCLRAQAGQ
jgi:hypothetical protein